MQRHTPTVSCWWPAGRRANLGYVYNSSLCTGVLKQSGKQQQACELDHVHFGGEEG